MAAGGGLAAGFWEPLIMLRDDGFVSGLTDEVGPFVGVFLHVVEFLRTIGITNVAPFFRADSVVVVIMGGDGGAVALGGGVFELGHQAKALEVLGWFAAGEGAEGGVNVEEFGRLLADALGDAGTGEDEGDAGAVIPEGVLSGDAFFANVPPVVGPEDDDGVVGEAIAVDGVHDFAHLGVDEGGAGEVAAGEVHPFVMLFKPGKAGLGKGPMHIPGEARGVVAITTFDERELGFVFGMEVEPFLGGEAGDVREEKSGGEEEGALGFGVEFFDGPFGDFEVTFVLVLVREEAPVDEFHFTGSVDEFLLGEGGAGGTGSEVLELAVLAFATVVAVVNFSGRVGGVAVLLEVLGEGGESGKFGEVAEPGAEPVDAGGVGAQAHHETGPGGVAQRRLAVGVGEKGAAGGKLVDVRGQGIGVSAEAADPVVLVIDGDEDDIGLFGRVDEREEEGEEEGFHDFGLR